ncbi:MAG: ATP-binding cassette subfamily B protein [Parasphingorhabdus sp.]|jgi:ATP-binding cassette subfamily B protein|uniref:ABC transporter transmembrane domain-containing protein n=1 Tax=Parasphingorhabdus sp. TaxID=2709688 RepID=UPI002B27AC54|nr:ABC transporter transmembrane domain-containing protein [Parasphingorhabdus sp.]|tara:strand:+ start:3191 stop:5005 length:1815 start_codon:yes stop_codon:yes gene_type:complete
MNDKTNSTEIDTPPAPLKKIGNLRMVFDRAIAYPKEIAFALLALIVSAMATLSIPAGFKTIIDKGFIAGNGDVAPYFQGLLGIVAVLAVATAFRFYFVSWLGERVVADLRLAVQNNLLRLAPGFFEENRPSEIASRMTSDTAIIEQVVGTTVSVALRNIVIGIGGIIYLFTLAPALTAGLLLAIPVIILPIVFIGRKLTNVSRSSQDRVADVGAMIAETLGAMKIVQAFGQEKREHERFSGAVESTFDTAKRRIRLRAAMTAIVIGLIFTGITMLMWRGAIGVSEGTISGGTIAAFVITGGLVAGAFGALTEVYGDLLRGAGAAGRLAELLSEKPGIAAPENPISLPVPSRGQIAFDNVSFSYPTRLDTQALANFSLTVSPGETVAVVGPSGAGKSTLFQLAQRFYDPQSGSVRIDGVALPSADPAEIRKRMALVPQETVLFAASARDNLRYGKWEATDEEIWEAARVANAEKFLRALPEGLDSFMGEAGTRLSGGQRQRISIARALLRNTPILLLDEATSALDAESEKLVQDALDHLMQDRTTIVIAHRLATVRSADRIVVMEEGRIVEQGDHDSLIAKNGLYARLAELQFSSAETSRSKTNA